MPELLRLVVLVSFLPLASPLAYQQVTNILGVVCDATGSQDVEWIRAGMPVDIVGHGTPKHISESRPWLQWVVENYYKLPSLVFFSHGHRSSWHSCHRIDKILSSNSSVTLLSLYPFGGDVYKATESCGEVPYLDALHGAFFNSSWKNWVKQNDVAQRPCCAENVVTLETIRRLDRTVYGDLVATIDAFPNAPWGRVFELFWESMFTGQLARDTEGIAKSLRDFRLVSIELNGISTRFGRKHNEVSGSGFFETLPALAGNTYLQLPQAPFRSEHKLDECESDSE